MLIVSLFKIANVLFWDFSITNVKFKHGKVEETQFWEKNLRKFNSLKIKKNWTVWDFHREPTSQTWWERYDEYFVFGS